MTYDIPVHWKRGGLVLARDASGGACSVAGDPCIVWDAELPGWRMVYGEKAYKERDVN